MGLNSSLTFILKKIALSSSATDIRVSFLVIKDFKIQRRGRQRERQKTIFFISKTTTLHLHHAFLYISLPVFARLRRDSA